MLGFKSCIKAVGETKLAGMDGAQPSATTTCRNRGGLTYKESSGNKDDSAASDEVNRKTGIVITTHGNYGSIAKRCLESFIANVTTPRYILLIINVSEDPETDRLERQLLKDGNVDVIRLMEDVGGLTKTWNLGIERCKNVGCKSVILSNHDLFVNSSIRHLISAADKCPSDSKYYYGPVTNNPGPALANKYQRSGQALNINPHILAMGRNLINLNGFLMCFPMHVLEDNKYDEENYFNPMIRYGGNETEWFNRFKLKGGLPILVPRAYVHHYKFASWRTKKQGSIGLIGRNTLDLIGHKSVQV